MQYVLWPTVTAGIAAVVGWFLGWDPGLNDRAAVLGFAGSVASIAATMLGFMLAALAVLASIHQTALVERLKRTGHYDDLLHTVFFGCAVFALIALGGFALLLGASAARWLMLALLGLHAAAAVSMFDIGRKFRLLLVNLR